MKKLKNIPVKSITRNVLDRCGREAEIDHYESKEFTSIELVGGYESISGDGARLSFDICQHCLKDTLGAWLKISTRSFTLR